MCPRSTLPVAGIAPISARSNVVLPAPLRPMSPHISPSFTASEASRMIGIGPIETLRFDTLSMARPRRGGFQPHAADQLLHAGIIQRLGRCSVRDDGAVIERQHPFGETRDDLHVVLDEKYGDLAGLERRHH